MSNFKETLRHIWGIKSREVEQDHQPIVRYKVAVQFSTVFEIDDSLGADRYAIQRMCEDRARSELCHHIYGGIEERLIEIRFKMAMSDFPVELGTMVALDQLIKDLRNGTEGRFEREDEIEEKKNAQS